MATDPKNMLPDDPSGKWTEIEHLPEWDEEFYTVYTAKKHGKWVMLKALKPEFQDNPEYQKMIEEEFDTRYNLSHPNIVMINDFEYVPGIGRAIICDDVYGKSLRQHINDGTVTEQHIRQLRTRLPMALQYIQSERIAHHPLRPETIIFTEDIGNLKLIDVGFAQRPQLTPKDASQDIAAVGRILLEALDALPDHGKRHPVMRHIAEKCVKATPMHNPYRNVTKLELALQHQKHDKLYIVVIVFLTIMIGVLAYVVSVTNTKPQADVPAKIENVNGSRN